MKMFMAVFAGMVLTGIPLVAEMAESEALASGYASAFANLGAARGSIVYSNETGTEIIRDVKEVQAFGGVVLIRKINGRREVLDPIRIVRIVQD
jgi:hypothetical protein